MERSAAEASTEKMRGSFTCQCLTPSLKTGQLISCPGERRRKMIPLVELIGELLAFEFGSANWEFLMHKIKELKKSIDILKIISQDFAQYVHCTLSIYHCYS